MRVQPWIAALIGMAACPAQAQMMGGPNSMSPIPGTELPDKSDSDLDGKLRAIAEQHGAQEAAAAFDENVRVRRDQAKQYAAAAAAGAVLPADAAATLRSELRADIGQWRAQFHVRRQELQAMEARWLVPLDSLSATEWAQRRVDWWVERDGWIARKHS